LIKTAAEVVVPDSDNDIDLADKSIPYSSLRRDQFFHRNRKKPLLATFAPIKSNKPIATVEVVATVLVIKMEVERG